MLAAIFRLWWEKEIKDIIWSKMEWIEEMSKMEWIEERYSGEEEWKVSHLINVHDLSFLDFGKMLMKNGFRVIPYYFYAFKFWKEIVCFRLVSIKAWFIFSKILETSFSFSLRNLCQGWDEVFGNSFIIWCCYSYFSVHSLFHTKTGRSH